MKKNFAKICFVISAMLLAGCKGGEETSVSQQSHDTHSSSQSESTQTSSTSVSEQVISDSEQSYTEEISFDSSEYESLSDTEISEDTSGSEEDISLSYDESGGEETSGSGGDISVSYEESSEEEISSEEESSEESSSIYVPPYISLMQGKTNQNSYYGGHLYGVYNGYGTVYCLDDGNVGVSVSFNGATIDGIENGVFYPAVVFGYLEYISSQDLYILRSDLSSLYLVTEDDVPTVSFDTITPVIENPTYGKTDLNSKFYRPFSFRGFVGGWDGSSFYFGKAGMNQDYIDSDHQLNNSGSSMGTHLQANYRPGNAIIVNGYMTYNNNTYYPTVSRILSSRLDEAFAPESVTYTTTDGNDVIDNISTCIKYHTMWTVQKKDIELPYPDYWIRGTYSQKGSYNTYYYDNLASNLESFDTSVYEGYSNEGEDIELSYTYQGVSGTIVGTNYKILNTWLSLYIDGNYAQNFSMSLGEKVNYEVREGDAKTGLPVKLSDEYEGLIATEDGELCAYKQGSYSVQFIAYGAEYTSTPRTQTITITVNPIEQVNANIETIDSTVFEKPTLVTMMGFVHIDGDDAYLLGEPYSGHEFKLPTRLVQLKNGSYLYPSHFAIDPETGEFYYVPDTSKFDIAGLEGETYYFHFVAQTIDGVNQYSVFIRGDRVDTDLIASITFNTNAEELGIPEQQRNVTKTYNVDAYYAKVIIYAIEGIVEEIKWHGEFYEERVLTPEAESDTNQVIVYAPICRASVFNITYKARTITQDSKTITNTSGFYPQGYKYDHATIDSYTVAGLNVSSWGVSNRNNAIEFICDSDERTAYLQINLPEGAILKSFDVDWGYSVSGYVEVDNIIFSASTGSGNSLYISNDAYSQTEDGKVFVLNGGTHNVADTYLKLNAYTYMSKTEIGAGKVNVTRILINYIFINQAD